MKKDEVEAAEEEKSGRKVPVLPLALAGVLIVALGAGFAIGVITRPKDDGPDMTPEQAYAQAKEETEAAVSRTMAERGYLEGRRSGRTHGIIAGGMRAESDASVLVREQYAGEAQAKAAAAQSELAGMTAAPAPPVPDDFGE